MDIYSSKTSIRKELSLFFSFVSLELCFGIIVIEILTFLLRFVTLRCSQLRDCAQRDESNFH